MTVFFEVGNSVSIPSWKANNLREEYPFVIRFEDLPTKAVTLRRWCERNLSVDVLFLHREEWKYGDRENWWEIFFEDEEDATLFKLTWM